MEILAGIVLLFLAICVLGITRSKRDVIEYYMHCKAVSKYHYVNNYKYIKLEDESEYFHATYLINFYGKTRYCVTLNLNKGTTKDFFVNKELYDKIIIGKTLKEVNVPVRQVNRSY